MLPNYVYFLLLFVASYFDIIKGMDKSLLYSPFNCGNSEWELSYNNTEVAARYFYDWLLHWQFDCEKNHPVNGKFAAGGGLGSSFMFGSKYFMDAIEMRQVFRPVHWNTYWTFAAENAENCTLNIRSYDCFSEPLSDCGLTNKRSEYLLQQLNASTERMVTNPLQQFGINPSIWMDICTFAKVLKKSVKWVHGHLMYYMIRPRQDVQVIINQRVQSIFANLPKHTVTLGMSGTLDNNRKQLTNLTEILHIIDHKVFEIFSLYNQTVSMVYLCGDIPEHTFKSGEYMNTHHARPYTFTTSHLVSFGKKDVEASLRSGDNLNQASRFDLFTDFITDIEILSTVDYLIGSNSNVYMVAAAIQAARQQHSYPENTCYVDRNEGGSEGDLRSICEGTAIAHKLWSLYFHPHYTIFEPYPMHNKTTVTEPKHHGRRTRKR